MLSALPRCVLVLALTTIQANARPFSELFPRQEPSLASCSDPNSVSGARCWSIADVPSYLNNDTTGWIRTTPQCDDLTRCCSPSEAWSTCFLRLASGQPGQDCTTLRGPCTVRPFDKYLHPGIVAQVKATVTSIYGVQAFFLNYAAREQPAVSP